MPQYNVRRKDSNMTHTQATVTKPPSSAPLSSSPHMQTSIACGCCGASHRSNYSGDCRSDAERFSDIPDDAQIVDDENDCTEEKHSMAQYNVRLYTTRCDEYEVEAATEDEARRLVAAYRHQTEHQHALPASLRIAVQKIGTEESHDFWTSIIAYDADGNFIA